MLPGSSEGDQVINSLDAASYRFFALTLVLVKAGAAIS